ncbi:hypothetical protein QBC47DRAFT_349128 [Echria macrotheca]|uniref:F-box domain-containing protein n=1 Tax=Echria macrotheca TaxID=438768 RepID=A0AAJ0B696_9PEZI|nr:hypothetical protein QBC47DRAFT_349128 [Echria macrotheca]
MRDITDLPHDLFLLVISHLPPRTCIACRSVSRQWLAAFTTDATSLLLLRWNFPRCRELRLYAASSSSRHDLSHNAAAEVAHFAETHRRPGAWTATFADVARRYHNLRHAQPRALEKLDVVDSHYGGGCVFSFYGVAPWNRFLRLDDKTANFHYPDPTWSFSQDDGVLVFPGGNMPGQPEGHVYQVLDLATNEKTTVPFDVRQKHVRRVRLAEGVLIFEWAEGAAYHQLNDREVVHRHFVSAFDVVRTGSGPRWTVTFRSEWKLHFLGLPLNRSDRFFSAHTSSHYAVYFWQPNRSLYQDDPIEQIAVWDISSPSTYKPSEDPNGDRRPAPGRAQTTPTGLWSGGLGLGFVSRTPSAPPGPKTDDSPVKEPPPPTTPAPSGPQVIRRMAWRELDHLGLRQRATPQLRTLALDQHNLYFVEEEHRWANGQHSSLIPPRVHLVRCTGIPIVPIVPLPQTTTSAVSPPPEGPVHGPIWVHECGADGDTNMNFCRRSSPSPPQSLPQEETTTTTQPFFLPSPPPPPPPAPSTKSDWFLSTQHQRDKRYAPCWRHEDFPYLTVTEMLDADAGVRVTARHCFMLETLSVHVRPGMIAVANNNPSPDENEKNKKGKGRNKKEEKVAASRTAEVQFGDEMWAELMGRGYIGGDERWVVGEDEGGRVTVLRF